MKIAYKNLEKEKAYQKLRNERKRLGIKIVHLTPLEKFTKRIKTTNNQDCWIWIGKINKQGYGRFHVGGGKEIMAHRYILEQVLGRQLELHVLHKCDNPPCVNPYHLFEGTQADNMHDMIAKGRGGNRGETNGRAKFNDRQVIEIRNYITKNGDSESTRKHLMNRYKIHRATLGDIILGKTFKHLL